MANGFRTVKAGANAARASADDIIATSEWPTLNILAEGYFSVPPDAGYTNLHTVFEHNLGYYAPFMVFNYHRDPTQFVGAIYDDANKIVREGGIANTRNKLISYNGDAQGYYILFDYNLERPFSTDRNIYSPSTNRSGNSGIKILSDKRSGRGMESGMLEDYNINTNGRSMTIHMNGVKRVDASTNYMFSLRHNLGYLPSYLLFMQDDITLSNEEFIYPLGNVVTATRSTLDIRGAQSIIIGNVYYAILKEPVGLDQ